MTKEEYSNYLKGLDKVQYVETLKNVNYEEILDIRKNNKFTQWINATYIGDVRKSTGMKENILKNVGESRIAREASGYKSFIEFESGVTKGVAEPKLYKVSESALKHSNVGDFTYNPKNGNVSKMKGGGHGQANIDFLEANGLKYEIVHTYPNGVRVGNVADHKVKVKRIGTNQSWFPESWTESDIVNAGEYVGNLKENINAVDGVISYGEVNGVRVGVIRTNGQISTVFPDAEMQS